jgi:hypothetical protein
MKEIWPAVLYVSRECLFASMMPARMNFLSADPRFKKCSFMNDHIPGLRYPLEVMDPLVHELGQSYVNHGSFEPLLFS